jgi:hypothetical protein
MQGPAVGVRLQAHREAAALANPSVDNQTTAAVLG